MTKEIFKKKIYRLNSTRETPFELKFEKKKKTEEKPGEREEGARKGSKTNAG